MLAEGQRFAQNYCAAETETRAGKPVTLPAAERFELEQQLRRPPQKAAQPKANFYARKLVIVIVRVPIVFRAPLVRIFVPPFVLGVPAALALCR